MDLIEYVIVDLLKVKWNSFVKRQFFTQFFIFIAFFILSSCCFIMRESTPQEGESESNCTISNMTEMISSNITEVFRRIKREDFLDINETDRSTDDIIASSPMIENLDDLEVNGNMTDGELCGEEEEEFNYCFHNTYDSLNKQVQLVMELVLIVWSFLYLVKAGHEYSFLGKRIFWDNMKMCPSRVVFLIGCITVLLMIPARLLCLTDTEDVLAIISMFCHGFYFLFFCRGFKLVGPMVTMIYRMMMQDLARFGTVFGIFVMGFSQAFFIIFLSFEEPELEEGEECEDGECVENNPMPDFVESILSTFQMSLGEVMDVWTALEQSNHEMIGKFHWFCFVMIVYILLLNLLIAMMGDTYAKIAAIKNEWMRQWARIVLIVERTMSPQERLRQQVINILFYQRFIVSFKDLYCDKNSDGEKALVMKQFLSDEKIDEINEIIEMKITHRKNIERRKAKFGYTITMIRNISNVILIKV